MTATYTVRRARADDREAVASFTRDTWPDRDVADYIPEVFDEWVAGDGDDQRTFVVDVREATDRRAEPGDVAAIAQGHRLTPWEAWASGMRVAPAHRGQGLAGTLTGRIFDWARDRGCVVCRNLTFSWNAPALGTSRRIGFEPCTELRWAQPAPDADAGGGRGDASPRPDRAWAVWSDSAAREQLRGLVLDEEQPWSLSTLTRERLHVAADEGRLLTVDEGRGGFAERVRTYEREDDGEPVDYAEYAVGTWPEGDADAAAAVLDAVARDAAAVGADRTRVMIPEGVTWASDASTARATITDEPAFVLAAPL
jgi:GNAT superfamily N-acetyltransferase